MWAEIFAAVAIFFQSLFGLNNPKPPFVAEQMALVQGKTPLALVEESPFVKSYLNPILPLRRTDVSEIEINASAVIALDANSEKILYQKNIHQELPIASLTKLMTASVILENADLEQIALISKNAVDTYGEMGNLVVGEKITFKNLLYVLLMESSNDAAVALSESLKENKGLDLVELMNKKNKGLGLNNTFFNDPSGLDKNNVSSAWDLSQITKYTLKQNLIWDILHTASADLPSDNDLPTGQAGRNHHLNTTNKLLQKMPEMIGGKTGYTEEAGECMIAAIQIPEKSNKIILVILGTKDRFEEMEKLINWVKKAYVF